MRTKDRISVPFFFQPADTTLIETMHTLVKEDESINYEPVILGEWITAKSLSML